MGVKKDYIYSSGSSRGISSSCATGKVSWLSKVLAQHIPGRACQPAGGSHPATGPHAAGEGRLLDGKMWSFRDGFMLR